MTVTHAFVETSFLYGIFCMPSKRNRDALALKARHDAGEVKLYVPYVAFQEARNLIGKSLPKNRCADILEFHRFTAAGGTVGWDFNEVKKLVDAATGEVSKTKALYQRELKDFARALGGGVLHGTADVFDFLESLDLDDEGLKYNDRLILSSVLVKAKQLHDAGVRDLYFLSLDKGDLQPTAQRPKMARYYADAGLTFVPGFLLPHTLAPSP